MQRAFIMAKDKEFEGWSQSEIDAGIEKLAEQIKSENVNWDNDGDYKLNMANDILDIYFSDSDSSDRFHDIGQVISKYVLYWARDEVTCNPDKYCEKIVPNDDF